MSSKSELRIVFMGEAATGAKSSLIDYYFTGRFTPSYDPTIEESYRVSVTVDGETTVADVLGLLLFLCLLDMICHMI